MHHITQAESEAQTIRLKLGIVENRWIDLPTVLTKVKRLIPGFNHRLSDDEVPEGKLAFWDSEHLEIVIATKKNIKAQIFGQKIRALASASCMSASMLCAATQVGTFAQPVNPQFQSMQQNSKTLNDMLNE